MFICSPQHWNICGHTDGNRFTHHLLWDKEAFPFSESSVRLSGTTKKKILNAVTSFLLIRFCKVSITWIGLDRQMHQFLPGMEAKIFFKEDEVAGEQVGWSQIFLLSWERNSMPRKIQAMQISLCDRSCKQQKKTDICIWASFLYSFCRKEEKEALLSCNLSFSLHMSALGWNELHLKCSSSGSAISLQLLQRESEQLNQKSAQWVPCPGLAKLIGKEDWL